MNLRGGLRCIARISLFIFPYSWASFLRKVFSYVASYRFGLLIQGKGRIFLKMPFYVLGHKYITVGDGFVADAGFRIECWDRYNNQIFTPSVIIGENVSFNYRCHIGCINRIIIGNNVLFGSQVLITDHSHGGGKDEIGIPPKEKDLYSKGPVIIEDNVWVGEGVCILPNVRIGENSIIGANAVVIQDIPPYSVAVGNPARVVKKLEVR